MCYRADSDANSAEQSSGLELVQLVENLPAPAYTCAPDGRITHCNQHAAQLWGRGLDAGTLETRYCGALRLFSTDGLPITHDQCFMALALQTDTECTGTEINIEGANGQRIPVLAHAKPLHDKLGRMVGALGIMVDISAQNGKHDLLQNDLLTSRNLERKFFEYSERRQSHLTHHLHEDLGQQLTGIAMLVRIVGKRLGEESHAELGRVIELAQLTSECIATACNLAKSSYPLELNHGGLNLTLEDLAHRTASFHKISCELEYEDSFQFAQEDSLHLYRIAQELVDNAIKHAYARNILIECKARQGVAALAVTNDGIPFKYLAGRGKGLDLDLMNSRARLFGARLEIQDAEVGGTVICWLDKPPQDSKTDVDLERFL